ncbi:MULTISPECIES: hypothetical protein [unclassified Streptomyces]|uniref:hypothetical protein n=1 Tax=unclassified Streptomyces TaxID=2593676 RepID=UPI00343C1D7D
MRPTVYTIEMAYAQMRSLQEQASRSRVHQAVTSGRAGAEKAGRSRRRAKKR